MSAQVTVQYTITPTGPTAANLAAVMAAVPLPFAVLQSMGLRLIGDTFPSQTERQVVLAFGPSATATATCTLTDTGTAAAVAVTDPGDDYILPPVVSFTGGGPGGENLGAPSVNGWSYPKARAYMNVQAAALVAGGTAYAASTTVAFVGGLPPALLPQEQSSPNATTTNANTPAVNGPPYAFNGVTLVKQGRGYSASTYVQMTGGVLQPGGHDAIVVITGFGPNGQILGLQVVDPGAGYITVPKIAFIDPVNGTTIASNETQAQAVALMGAGTPATATVTFTAPGSGIISGITGLTPGEGYVSPPSMVVYDPTAAGSGASLTARMGVGNIVFDYKGFGMTTAPTVVLTPYFKSRYPDGSDQRVPFYNFPLFWALQQATASEVVPSVPFLA